MADAKRGPYRSGLERRRRIIEAADRRFVRDGYHQTPLATIARDVGITDAGLLHHFPSKAHLLIAVSSHRFRVADEEWADLGENPSFLAILALMWRTTDQACRQDTQVELDVIASAEAVDPSSPTHQAYVEGFTAAIADTTQRLHDARERGEIHSWIDPESLARECFALGNGLNLQWVMCGRSFDLSSTLLGALGRIAAAASTTTGSPDELAQRIRDLASPSH